MDLDALRTRDLPLAELAQAVGELCGRIVGGRRDERVRDAPDERTLRYYQTLGLLDRPVRYDGRVAVYGFRHVLQAVAVKALQAEGHSLAQIQAALTGMPTGELEQAVVAALGGAPPPPAVPAPPGPPTPSSLVAFTIAPGVTVLVDPARVHDAAALARALAAAALPHLTSNGDSP